MRDFVSRKGNISTNPDYSSERMSEILTSYQPLILFFIKLKSDFVFAKLK